MIQLDIVSDPICPWCYIGKTKLDAAMAEAGDTPFDIRWRIFQLNPDMPADGMDRRTYLETKFGGPDRAAQVYGRIEAAAEEAGLQVAFDRIARTPNTLDAHRLIHWAGTTGHQQPVVDALFRRYFVDGDDISDRHVLADIAEGAGMDRSVVIELLAGDADRELLQEQDEAARRMGVTGVPCFIVDGRYVIQGAQNVETWRSVIAELTTALAEGRPEAR
ncbi:MAG: DsbA family oxidoreductase [Paracoccaceae bacterium]